MDGRRADGAGDDAVEEEADPGAVPVAEELLPLHAEEAGDEVDLVQQLPGQREVQGHDQVHHLLRLVEAEHHEGPEVVVEVGDHGQALLLTTYSDALGEGGHVRRMAFLLKEKK